MPRMDLIVGAQRPEPGDILEDPLLALGAAALIVVSVAWVLVWRFVVAEITRALLRGEERPEVELLKPTRDIWKYPP